ncbi:hypothetical protein VNO77_44475 [Canavalia gladiata]|uniref:Protein kinase domain-containing protein n=1 Tax=Canavalia gladiata TaxID=3824 RepID=A0AAN9PR26_CANGL
MGMRWNTFGFWLTSYICLISVCEIRECLSLNEEGLALLECRARITLDPYDALANWNPNDCDPCKWIGVHCVDGKVQMLELRGLSLEGTLAPELGKLSRLKSLVLSKNNFSGAIPKELGDLANLELLDLRENNLSGSIPPEIGKMLLLKNFVWQSNFKQWNKSDSLMIPIKTALMKCLNAFPLSLFKLGKPDFHGPEENYCDVLPSSDEPEIMQNEPNLVNSGRKLLDQSSNLAAAPFSGGPTVEFSSVPTTLSSGAFPAVPDANKKQNQSPAPSHSPSESSHDASDVNQTSQQHSSNGASGKLRKYIIIIAAAVVLVIVIIILLFIWRKRAAKVITPWKTGISGQLRKAFITGLPKLNRAELETACEDFSNIIISYPGCTIYKGTLSNGVEIAVVSTLIASSQDWSKHMEINYRRKIDTLSRVNHKNFINLIGYCEEQEPFTRMLVFEYAPNGNLFENLHVGELDRLDWSERIRIIMGIAYCLQYMHHDVNPPVAHNELASNMIFLTDDFAAKVAEVTFRDIELPAKTTGNDSKKSDSLSQIPFKRNVYEFGFLLLEIISGKLPNCDEQDNGVNWAAEYINDKKNISYIIDPTLQSFKDNELDVICDVIHECTQPDPKLRPTMREVTSKLREGVGVSPEQAVPRLSPLWWAELEILSVEAT